MLFVWYKLRSFRVERNITTMNINNIINKNNWEWKNSNALDDS